MNCWLEGCFSNFNMLLRFSSPRDLVKRQILIQGPRFCIFSKFPSDANASGWWTTLGTVRGDVVLSLRCVSPIVRALPRSTRCSLVCEQWLYAKGSLMHKCYEITLP